MEPNQSLWWRVLYCFWMARFNWGSNIPWRAYWAWSAEDYDGQAPGHAAMDDSFHLLA